jgi:hypothetical protein
LSSRAKPRDLRLTDLSWKCFSGEANDDSGVKPILDAAL